MKKTTCEQIKIGDKVNRREKGWAEVIGIDKSFIMRITFKNGDVMHYGKFDEIFISEN